MSDEYIPTEFERKLGELHLQVYHLMLDIDTTYCQAVGCGHVVDAFEKAWDLIKECDGTITKED